MMAITDRGPTVGVCTVENDKITREHLVYAGDRYTWLRGDKQGDAL